MLSSLNSCMAQRGALGACQSISWRWLRSLKLQDTPTALCLLFHDVQEVEIDAVIIGLKYGTGRRSGSLSEYLLALAEKPQNGAARPSTFVTFCM